MRLAFALVLVLAFAVAPRCSGAMTNVELSELRDRTVQLFKHAFGSYMAHAFPMDELLPLSCKGTNSFGGVSVTLIDSLDTLAVMGLRQEFAEAVEVQAFRIAATFANCDTFSLFLATVGCSQYRHHAECKHQVPLPKFIIYRSCTRVPIHLSLSRTQHNHQRVRGQHSVDGRTSVSARARE